MADTVYQYRVREAQGTELSMDNFRGKVVLVLNVASR